MEVVEIKKHLKKYKITYAQLAELSGLNLTTIKRIFSGHIKNPHVETMRAIEQALGFINTQSEQPPTLSESERELLETFRQLSPYLQGLTLDTVRSFAGNSGDGLHKKA